MSSTLVFDESGEPLHVQQRRQIDAYRAAWKEAGHAREPRVSVSRSIFAIVDDRDRAYFGRGQQEHDQIGYIDENTRAVFGRSYAAEPEVLVEQLKEDTAIAAADTLLLTVPNQLGVDYNAHAIESHPALRRAGARLALMGPRRPRSASTGETSWERVATWYDGWVGDHGSAYHQQLAIPAVLDLLQPAPGEEILDVGGGQGVLAPYLGRVGRNGHRSRRLGEADRRREAAASVGCGALASSSVTRGGWARWRALSRRASTPPSSCSASRTWTRSTTSSAAWTGR